MLTANVENMLVTSMGRTLELFCGLLLCFPEQLLILGDQSVQRHQCLYERV